MALISYFLLFLLPLLVRAHMQMNSPYPIRSPFDPQVSFEQKDYDYTSPLAKTGMNFPCKGYQNNRPIRTTARYYAGQQYTMSLAGTATHGGGSCQLSLSYDNGATFKVIKSIIGGCPLSASYNFTIPTFAPSGTALFAWSWFNMIGNREMYMNCAEVEIVSSLSGRRRRTQYKRKASMDNLPNIFVANVNQLDQCASIEGEDVVFPDPGPDVIYGSSISHTQIGNGFSCRGSLLSSIATSPFNVSVPSTPTPPFANTTTSSISTTSRLMPITSNVSLNTSMIISTSSLTTRTTMSPPPPTSTPLPSWPCVPNSLACNSNSTFSMCNGPGNAYIFMGSVAAGTTCENSKIVMANAGPCNGLLHCGPTGRTFYLCSNGGLIYMGPTASGTICIDGQIVAG